MGPCITVWHRSGRFHLMKEKAPIHSEVSWPSSRTCLMFVDQQAISTWTRLASSHSQLDQQLSVDQPDKNRRDSSSGECPLELSSPPIKWGQPSPYRSSSRPPNKLINSHRETPVELKKKSGDGPYGTPTTKYPSLQTRQESTGIHSLWFSNLSEVVPAGELGSLYDSQTSGCGNQSVK